MDKTGSMTKNHNNDDDDDASSTKMFKTCDTGDVATWSHLTHDVLMLVMLQLGVIDFFAFSKVCKSWRSLALSNKKKFVASRPPIRIGIFTDDNEKEHDCYIEDFEGRKLKTLLHYSIDRTCIGLTCGYLVLFGNETKDFLLVNPITSHQLHIPRSPINVCHDPSMIKAILVFSPSMNGWVFVVLHKYYPNLWFYVAGKGVWNSVSSTFPILDLLAFKGKIYTLNAGWRVCELTLGLNPKFTLLDIKNLPKEYMMVPKFVRSYENLYGIDCSSSKLDTVLELDFGEMKWVSPKEKLTEKYVFSIINWKHGPDKGRKATSVASSTWYFPE